VDASPDLLQVVVVPTNRAFAHTREALGHAVALASAFRARLLVVCSGDARPGDFPRDLLTAASCEVLLVDFPAVLTRAFLTDLLPVFGTRADAVAVASGAAMKDTADKRNLGLVVAAAKGWYGALFLDDDVKVLRKRSLDVASLAAGMSMLRAEAVQAAGWPMVDYPDNSVVCHARRLAGLPQDCFVSGAALAVRVSDATPFFPPAIYNEDWLFQFPLLRAGTGRGRGVTSLGVLGQQPYQPYRVDRAAQEEIGDVLAEGLFGLLQGERDVEACWRSPAYWESVIRGRRAMIANVRLRLTVTEWMSRRAAWERRWARRMRKLVPALVLPATQTAWRKVQTAGRTTHRAAAIAALDAAARQHGSVGDGVPLADAICDYLRVWQDDLELWGKHLAVPPVRAVERLLADPAIITRLGSTLAGTELGVTRPVASAQVGLDERV